MKIILLSIGKTDDPLFSQIIEEYRKRVNYYIPFEMQIIPDTLWKRTKKAGRGKTAEMAATVRLCYTARW